MLLNVAGQPTPAVARVGGVTVVAMTMGTVEGRPVAGGRRSADSALTQLYAAHWAEMVRLAYLLVRDQGIAEDIVQDALIAIHRRWEHLSDQDNAVAYLRRSVVNGARSVLRHRKVEHIKLAAQAAAAERTAVAPSAEQAAMGALGNDAMLRALDTLPRRQREVLVLRYFSDLSEAQIAHALDIAPGSVKAHASRGLAALRERLIAQRTQERT
jgi:RNA polymerase sigma-70 factor (sigma-E family)